MKHPKFIITNRGYLRLDIVYLHRDLLMPHEDCLGGGFYEYDYVGDKLMLSDKSYDYGYPQWSKINVLKVSPRPSKECPSFIATPGATNLS